MDKVKFNPFSEILDQDFNRQSKYVGDAVSLFIKDFLTEDKAVVLGLSVNAQAVSDMTVYVTPGRLYQVGKQGQITVNSNPPLAITAAHPDYDRIDRVCARYAEIDVEPETRNVMVDTVSRQVVQKTVMTRIAGTVEFMIVSGTPAPTPAVPTVPDGWVSLAKVNVNHGITSVEQISIIDERPTISAYLKHMHTGGGDGTKISYKNLIDAPDLSIDLAEHNTSETAHEDIRALVEMATKKAGLPVGFEYTISYTELQAGQIPLLGGKYLKSTYTDLWAWVQTHPSMIVTETEWQSLKTASGGRAVPFYADVDDQYFRVPLVTTWVRGATSLDKVGTVLEAGLPNVTGEAGEYAAASLVSNGALRTVLLKSGVAGTGSTQGIVKATFDASLSNAIYGKSTTVQPQSVCRLWVVQAFGTTSNTGNLDMAQVAQGVSDLTSRVSTLEADSDFAIIYPNDGTKETPANVSVNSRYVMDNPFPGYEVECRAEILYSGKWCKACWSNSTVNNGFGIMATHLLPDDNIIVQTGNSALSDSSVINGIGIQNMVTLREAAPCRVKVWKIGKVTS